MLRSSLQASARIEESRRQYMNLFVRMQRNSNYYQMKRMEIGEFLIGFIFFFIKIEFQNRLKRLSRDVFFSNDI